MERDRDEGLLRRRIAVGLPFPQVIGLALALLAGAGSSWAFPSFDGAAAFDRVRAQCALGPRVPGTEGHARCLRWMIGELEAMGASYERQDFRLPSPVDGDTLELTNLLVRIAPEKRPRLLLGAHWDTRPWSDEESDPALRDLPVPGANDGASGVAALLGLAEALLGTPPPIGVDLAFFDAEDMGRPGHPYEYSLGSQWMARNWAGALPDYVLVLDMIASPKVVLGRDLISHSAFPEWNELIFGIARARGYTEFDPTRAYTVYDDHIPFLERGIPSTVLIGFDDPNWHTQRDVPEALDPERIRRVGEVVLELVYGRYLGP